MATVATAGADDADAGGVCATTSVVDAVCAAPGATCVEATLAAAAVGVAGAPGIGGFAAVSTADGGTAEAGAGVAVCGVVAGVLVADAAGEVSAVAGTDCPAVTEGVATAVVEACAGTGAGATTGEVAFAVLGTLTAEAGVLAAEAEACGAGVATADAGVAAFCAAAGCSVPFWPGRAFCAFTAPGTVPVPGAPISGNTVPCCRLPNLGCAAEARDGVDVFVAVAGVPLACPSGN